MEDNLPQDQSASNLSGKPTGQAVSVPILDWIDRANVSQVRMLNDPAYRRSFEERIERLLSRTRAPGVAAAACPGQSVGSGDDAAVSSEGEPDQSKG
jgi:hypothetical protein